MDTMTTETCPLCVQLADDPTRLQLIEGMLKKSLPVATIARRRDVLVVDVMAHKAHLQQKHRSGSAPLPASTDLHPPEALDADDALVLMHQALPLLRRALQHAKKQPGQLEAMKQLLEDAWNSSLTGIEED